MASYSGSSVPAIRLAHEDPHQFGLARLALVRLLRLRPSLLLRRDLDHGRILNLNQAIGDHVVEGWKKLLHFLGGLDEFDPDGKMLGQDFYFRGVHDAVARRSRPAPALPSRPIRPCARGR